MGILHGPITRAGSYLSNQMPRTFAPKSDYAIRFWKKHSMQAPKVDVLAAIKRKANLVFRSPAFDFEDNNLDSVIHGDASVASTWSYAPDKIDMVITSPPYYGMQTYVPDQWLRNWFVGGPETVEYRDKRCISSSIPDDFAKTLAKVWNQIALRVDGELHMFVRFGVLPSRKLNARTLLFQSFEESRFAWKRVYTKCASIAPSGRRQAEQMHGLNPAETEFDAHVRLV